MGRKSVAGSNIGGIVETQRTFDGCREYGIILNIKLIAIQGINKAYKRMIKSDAKCRFVEDMASPKARYRKCKSIEAVHSLPPVVGRVFYRYSVY